MKHNYIFLWEVHDENGVVLCRGNSGCTTQTAQGETPDAKEIMDAFSESTLGVTKESYPEANSIIITGMFKL